jgi:excisionase family DNA binding protein
LTRPWGERPLERSDILDRDEVADLLGLKPSTVDEYRRRGELPFVRLGRHHRYLRADVEAWLLASRNGSGA